MQLLGLLIVGPGCRLLRGVGADMLCSAVRVDHRLPLAITPEHPSVGERGFWHLPQPRPPAGATRLDYMQEVISQDIVTYKSIAFAFFLILRTRY